MMGDAPKNLALNLKNTKLEGIVSSATQHYREGLRFLEETIREELSNVTQTPAPTVNNGVLVSLDENSVWTVSGDSYITSLTLAQGATVKAPEGKQLEVTVDGKAHEVYLCASEDFKAKSESKIALDAYKEVDVYPPQKAPVAPAVSSRSLFACTWRRLSPETSPIKR